MSQSPNMDSLKRFCCVIFCISLCVTIASTDTLPEHQARSSTPIPTSPPVADATNSTTNGDDNRPVSTVTPQTSTFSSLITNTTASVTSGSQPGQQNSTTLRKESATTKEPLDSPKVTVPSLGDNKNSSQASAKLGNETSSAVVKNVTTPSVETEREQPLILSQYSNQEAREMSRVTLPELGVASHSGFITVNDYLGSHLFFWLIIAQQLTDTTPLLLWLDGGPGLSSMTGMLYQHGPIGVRFPKSNDETVDVVKRTSFWSKQFCVLYIDSPIGVGYSFSEHGNEGHRNSTSDVAYDLVSFLVEFLWIFPEFLDRDLYIGGHHYGAKYAISLAHEIWHLTEGKPGFFPLKGVFLAAPLFDPSSQLIAPLNALYSFGALSFSDRNNYAKVFLDALGRFEAGLLARDFNLTSLTEFIRSKIPKISLDNYVTGERLTHRLISLFMTSQRVRSALHVGKETRFHAFNVEVHTRFGYDYFRQYRDELAVVMNTYKVLVYSGNYDVTVHNSGVEAAILNTPWAGDQRYANASRLTWSGFEGEVNGFYSKVDRFCRVVVNKGGHFVSRDQPEVMERVISDFVEYGCLSDLIYGGG